MRKTSLALCFDLSRQEVRDEKVWLPLIPAAAANALAAASNADVLLLVAQHPQTPTDVLVRLAESSFKAVRAAVAARICGAFSTPRITARFCSINAAVAGRARMPR